MPLHSIAEFTTKPRGLQMPEKIPFVPMELIPAGEIFINSYELRENISSGTYCEKGDVLLPKITPSFENGKQGIVGEDIPSEFVYATTEVIPIKPSDSLDSHFLFFYLLHRPVRLDLAGKMEGTTGRQRIPKTVVENMLVPLPPLPEQRAIARILTTVREAIEATDRVLTAARELKRSLMHHCFTYGLVPVNEADQVVLKETEIGDVPEGWEVVKIGDIADIHSGGTPSRNKPEYWNGSISWVKTGEINYSTITSTEESISQAGFQNSSARLIPPGTLLMAMYGQGVTRGRVAILGIEATINQACAAFFLNQDVSSKFLFYLFTYHYERIRNMGHGAHQKNLSGTLIKTIPIALPPTLDEQNRIVAILSDVDQKIQTETQRKTTLENLFQSLLHHLMTGKLRVEEVFTPAFAQTYDLASDLFQETVLVADLVYRQMQIKGYEVSRFRYAKLTYFYDRLANREAAMREWQIHEHGPYNPAKRHDGVEDELISRGYLVRVDKTHFQIGENISEALKYAQQFHNHRLLQFVIEEFGSFHNDKLELWTTVDLTILKLREIGHPINASQIRAFWQNEPKWRHKLVKFSAGEINRAMAGLEIVFNKLRQERIL